MLKDLRERKKIKFILNELFECAERFKREQKDYAGLFLVDLRSKNVDW